MVNDLLALIARSNIALAVCVLVVLALRSPTRRLAGARIAYALWLIPPLAAAVCFLPARVQVIELPALAQLSLGAMPAVHAAALEPRYILATWIGGVAISLIVLILRQTRFARALGRLRRRDDLGEHVLAAESSEHGPAVLGVLRPMIITPADFEARFSDAERRIVLEHERAHVAQGDPMINAFGAALQCVNWFNPFVHLGVRALRIDQELACDAAVLATAARRSYAEAILKTQIAAGAPLGCAWPSPSLVALKERIAMLKHNLPTPTQRALGVAAIGLASFTACAVAWAAQPARVVVASHTDAAPLAAATPLPPDPLAPAAYAMPASSGAATSYVEAALAGAPGDAANDDDASVAEDEANVDNGSDLSGDLAELDAPNHVVTIVDDNGQVSRRTLTQQEREHIHAAVRRAMAARRTAMAQARVAMRDAQRAMAQAHVAARIEASPEMRAEIAAIDAQAARMAQSVHVGEAEREAMRADMQAHAARLREMAHEMAEEARAEAMSEMDRERARHHRDAHDDDSEH